VQAVDRRVLAHDAGVSEEGDMDDWQPSDYAFALFLAGLDPATLKGEERGYYRWARREAGHNT